MKENNIEEDVMPQEAFNELIDNFEVVATLTMYGRKSIKHYVKKMQAELDQKDKRIKELEEERKRVLDLIFEYGQIDGGHHKMWVIDQIVRILTKDKYNEWVKNYVYDEETGDIYSWDKGIAP